MYRHFAKTSCKLKVAVWCRLHKHNTRKENAETCSIRDLSAKRDKAMTTLTCSTTMPS